MGRVMRRPMIPRVFSMRGNWSGCGSGLVAWGETRSRRRAQGPLRGCSSRRVRLVRVTRVGRHGGASTGTRSPVTWRLVVGRDLCRGLAVRGPRVRGVGCEMVGWGRRLGRRSRRRGSPIRREWVRRALVRWLSRAIMRRMSGKVARMMRRVRWMRTVRMVRRVRLMRTVRMVRMVRLMRTVRMVRRVRWMWIVRMVRRVRWMWIVRNRRSVWWSYTWVWRVVGLRWRMRSGCIIRSGVSVGSVRGGCVVMGSVWSILPG